MALFARRERLLSLFGARVIPTLLLAGLTASQLAQVGGEAHVTRAVYHALSAGVWIMFLVMIQIRPAPLRRNRALVGVAAALLSLAPGVFIGVDDANAMGTRLLVANALLLGGMLFSVASVAVLGRCFGILPDARGLVTRGPYRLVRHPLYLGELVAIFGMVVASAQIPLALAEFVVLVVVQLVRTRFEEQTLRAEFPAYATYAAETPYRILPGLRDRAVVSAAGVTGETLDAADGDDSSDRRDDSDLTHRRAA